jgi:regulator of RNase E activity RraA
VRPTIVDTNEPQITEGDLSRISGQPSTLSVIRNWYLEGEIMTNKRQNIVERFVDSYAAAVSDAADAAGIGAVCMDSGIGPVSKNKRVVGFARTAKTARSAANHPYDEEQIVTFMTLASRANKYDVIVVDMSGATDCSGWGQIVTRIAVSRGAVGTIVDGTVRDQADVDTLDFPVFARGRHPGTLRGRLDVESIGESIKCGGVTVHHGDLILGDGDGVVVIPQDRIDEVAVAADEIVAADTWWEDRLKEGKDPHELHKEKPIP